MVTLKLAAGEKVDEDRHAGERKEEGDDAVADDQGVDRRGLRLGDGRVDQRLREVSLPGDDVRKVGRFEEEEERRRAEHEEEKRRDREYPRNVPQQ